MTDPFLSLGDVLIVIPCLDEEAHLPELLDRLIADAPAATIVVADGGSRDASRDIVTRGAASHPGLHLLDNPRRIQSAGVNLAVRRFGRGRRWLVRVDAHCQYPQDFVAGLVQAAQEHDATSVVVPMRTTGTGCFQQAAAAAQNSKLGTGGSAHRHLGIGQFVDHGHHALMRIDAFTAAGGYCEAMVTNEDAELDHRLHMGGGRIWLEPALAIDYFPRRDPIALFRQYRRYGTGRAMTILRHRMRPKPRQMAPLVIVPAVLLAAVAPLVSAWLALPMAAWALVALAYGALLGLRGRSRCTSLAGVAAMTMHLGWSFGFWRQWLFGAPMPPAPQPLALD